jgi:hypothetical protein
MLTNHGRGKTAWFNFFEKQSFVSAFRAGRTFFYLIGFLHRGGVVAFNEATGGGWPGIFAIGVVFKNILETTSSIIWIC